MEIIQFRYTTANVFLLSSFLPTNSVYTSRMSVPSVSFG